MTTSVTIKTVGWPVEIETVDFFEQPAGYARTVETETVTPAYGETTVYIHQGRAVTLTERAGPPEPQPASE